MNRIILQPEAMPLLRRELEAAYDQGDLDRALEISRQFDSAQVRIIEGSDNAGKSA